MDRRREDLTDAGVEAFLALTPGRRRYWLIHFAEAKQATTRAARITKAREKILAGKGLNEA